MINKTPLVIACGALAREIKAIQKINKLDIEVCYLSANLHNTPNKILEAIESKIIKFQENNRRIFIAYGDCGTGGGIKRLANKYLVGHLTAAHCYQMFSPKEFSEIKDSNLGTFYLTDFLAKNFFRLVIDGLGIADCPELIHDYFSNYHRILYLIQDPNHCYKKEAKKAAEILGLSYYEKISGYGVLDKELIIFSKK